jgi:hypothetical protein
MTTRLYLDDGVIVSATINGVTVPDVAGARVDYTPDGPIVVLEYRDRDIQTVPVVKETDTPNQVVNLDDLDIQTLGQT